MPFRGENVYPRNIKAKRTDYSITSDDINNGFATIPVLWDSQFPDANYTLSQAVVDKSGHAPDSLNFVVCGSHDITATGYNAVIFVSSGSVIAGDDVQINSIAIHDLFLLP